MNGCGFVEKKSLHIHADENFMLRISSKLECFSYHHFNNKLSKGIFEKSDYTNDNLAWSL